MSNITWTKEQTAELRDFTAEFGGYSGEELADAVKVTKESKSYDDWKQDTEDF